MKYPQQSGKPFFSSPTLVASTAVRVLLGRENRPAWGIVNFGTDTVYFGSASTVTDAGATRGWPIFGGQTPYDSFSDTTINSEIWVYLPAGKTGNITVMEVIPQP